MAHFNRISLVSLLALGVAMPVYAQETTPPAEPSADQGRDVVVVTANKREESVQDIAVAVTAVTAEAREEQGISTITDLTNLTPGLAYTAGNERITLRGIGRNTNNFGAEPGVANYTDGIYQSFASIAGREISSAWSITFATCSLVSGRTSRMGLGRSLTKRAGLDASPRGAVPVSA